MKVMKNSEGKKSSSLTFAWLSFIACIIFIFLGLIEEITISGNSYKFRMISSDLIMSLLIPSFSLYGYRRHTDAKYFFKDHDTKSD